MAKTRGTGLLMVWADIDPEYEAEFNRWYDEEHIAHLLAVPGFLSAGRYEALKGGPKYLALYELEDHNVLRTTTFLDTLRYQPSPLRAKAAGAIKLRENNSMNVLRGNRPEIIGGLLQFQTLGPEEADEIDQTGQAVNLLAMLKHRLAAVNP